MIAPEQISRIAAGTERIIEECGFRITHPAMQNLARDHGADVDRKTGRIRIPAPLLRTLLSGVPRRFDLHGYGNQSYGIGSGAPWLMNITNDPFVLDYDTQKMRRPCLDDVVKHTVMGQKFERVAAMSCMDFPVTDFTDAASSWRAMEAHLLHHDKHILLYAASEESFERWKRLLDILESNNDPDKRRIASVAVAVISPLTISDFNVDMAFEACRRGYPVIPTICPMAGSTGPNSIASVLLLGNTENVFLAALVQMIRPGHPFFYAFGPSATDFRNGNALYYTLDKALWKTGTVLLAERYNMAKLIEAGGSMTGRHDQQSGLEGFMFMLAGRNSGASGGDMLAGFGSNCNAMGMGAEQMVIQHAYLRAAEFLRRGLDTGEDELGVEALLRAGPGGNFLEDGLTLAHLRDDAFFRDDCFDHSGGMGESASMLERAHAKVLAMTRERPLAMPEKLRKPVAEFFGEEYRRMAVRRA